MICPYCGYRTEEKVCPRCKAKLKKTKKESEE